MSDPVPVRVPSDTNLLGSLYTPHDSGPATYQRSALPTSFLIPDGDHTPEQVGTATTGSWYHGVDVLGSRTAGSVVAQGDSITDGYGSTTSANHGRLDRLTTRLRQLPPHERLGVLNAGTTGKRVLLKGTGLTALPRLDADVLSRSGVHALIVMEGIHGNPTQADPAASAAAYREIVTRAPTPAASASSAARSPRTAGTAAGLEGREAVRQFVDGLIRCGGIVDAAVRDPDVFDRALPAFASRDHLHFDNVGLQATADKINLRSPTEKDTHEQEITHTGRCRPAGRRCHARPAAGLPRRYGAGRHDRWLDTALVRVQLAEALEPGPRRPAQLQRRHPPHVGVAIDEPFEEGSSTDPRTEMRWKVDYTTGNHMWDADVHLPSGTDGASFVQILRSVHPTDTPATDIMLNVYDTAGGTVRRYDGTVLRTGAYDTWFNVKIAHQASSGTGTIKVYFDDSLVLTVADRGPATRYFKNGVYDHGSGRSEARFRNLRYWTR
ncbi:GDSL-type esterase/lipase family protein [Streptomyces sp. NPDC051572]|uniref:SGNH/GDSL hydrolase family protein n=1 Tax=Streptomyces sp. NPDC051572 TaxID=3155802 RepID=UPI00344F318A